MTSALRTGMRQHGQLAPYLLLGLVVPAVWKLSPLQAFVHPSAFPSHSFATRTSHDESEFCSHDRRQDYRLRHCVVSRRAASIPDITSRVVDLVEQLTKVDGAKISNAQHLMELGIDAKGMVEIVMALEEHFGVSEFSDDELEKMETAREMAKVLKARFDKGQGSMPARAAGGSSVSSAPALGVAPKPSMPVDVDIVSQVGSIISDVTGLPASKLIPTASLELLGINARGMVELVFALEDGFAISGFSDDEIDQMVTVGDICEIITANLGQSTMTSRQSPTPSRKVAPEPPPPKIRQQPPERQASGAVTREDMRAALQSLFSKDVFLDRLVEKINN